MTDIDVDLEPEQVPASRPPLVVVSPARWVRDNLFNSILNSVLTIVFGWIAAIAIYRGLNFVFSSAEWDIVRVNLTNFLIGRFDRAQLWRPWAAAAILSATVGLVVGSVGVTAKDIAIQQGRELVPVTWRDRARRFWPLLLLAIALLALAETWLPALLTIGVLLTGLGARFIGQHMPAVARRLTWLIGLAGLVLAVVVLSAAGGIGWDRWGGLHVNVFVSLAGIVIAFPLGMVLALGRRSSLPAIRYTSVVYIEFFRGVPLIALLLFGQYMVGFFLPAGMAVPSPVIRALIVIVLFESAYLAEIVRGGLQSVDPGQLEAAQAVGLSRWTAIRRIMLPQALRNVIPATVGQFISLFQDTTLLSIIGFFEVLQVGRTVPNQPEFLGQGLHGVTLPFVAFVFWAISYSMSRESRRLETRLGVGTR